VSSREKLEEKTRRRLLQLRERGQWKDLFRHGAPLASTADGDGGSVDEGEDASDAYDDDDDDGDDDDDDDDDEDEEENYGGDSEGGEEDEEK
jgi:hypothetical protein